MKLRITLFILGVAFLLPPLAFPAFAQSTDVSDVYDIPDSSTQGGDILITTNKGLTRAATAYDSHIFGVLQDQPLLVMRRADGQGKPVARASIAEVNVTTLAGTISAGDYITSSEIPGAGQKATASGYVIGIALASFTDSDGQKIDFTPSNPSEVRRQVASGKIPVALKIEYAEITKARTISRLFDSIGIALFSSAKDPSKVAEIFRYVAAGAVVLSSFAFSFFTFSRSIPKAIEAIGRNPLAQKAILFSVILNIFFTILVAAVGITAAVFIIRM